MIIKSLKFSFFAVAIAFLFAFIPTNRKAEATRIVNPKLNLDFTLINQTGYPIDRIHLTPTSQGDWGENIMGEVLKSGYQSRITFAPSSTSASWDLQAHYAGYDESSANLPIWYDIDLTKWDKITLKWDAAKGVSSIIKE